MAQTTLTPIDTDAVGKRLLAAIDAAMIELQDAGLSESDAAGFLGMHAVFRAGENQGALTTIRDFAEEHLAACIDETVEDRSSRAHDVVDLAVLDLRDIGFTGIAPFRIMAWKAFEGIRAESSVSEAVDDLTRLREMIDKHLTYLASGVPQ